MKKKVLAIVIAAVLTLTSVMPIFGAGGDNTGEDIFDAGLYIQFAATEGDYNLGDEFLFNTTIYTGDSLAGITAKRAVTIDGPAAITGFQYKNDGQWTSIDSYNVSTTIKNDLSREYKVVFNEVGTYEINYKITDGADTVYAAAETKYVTITETSYSVSRVKPEEPTTPEITTTAPSGDETTTAPSGDETTTAPSDDETTTAPSGDETTTAPSGDETTTAPSDDESTTAPSDDETTTAAPETTTVAPAGDETTTVVPTTAAKVEVKAPAKAKIAKVTPKKKAAKKVKLTIKEVKRAVGYQVAVYTTKKNAKKNKKAIVKKTVKKLKVTVKSKKLKNKKKLYVKVRAYVLDGSTKVYGKWSKIKKVKVK